MFNLQTLTAKARELRGNVVKATTTKGTRTMTPVYEREEQRKLRERIQQTQPDWVLLWWDIATVTGWRTSDVCNFRYSCINWETGIATIIVAKQTKAAEARATRKGIEIVRQQRKDAARLAGDHIGYMHWDSVSCDELAAGMTGEEQAIVFELVAKAEVKHDTKQLPPGIIKRLRERMERNLIGDDLVFSRSQIESNRCQSLEGSVSRQTIWKKLHNVMVWFTRVVNTRLRLSAYSSRKIAAFNLMSAGGEQGLLVASEMLGHSNQTDLCDALLRGNAICSGVTDSQLERLTFARIATDNGAVIKSVSNLVKAINRNLQQIIAVRTWYANLVFGSNDDPRDVAPRVSGLANLSEYIDGMEKINSRQGKADDEDGKQAA